MDVELAPNLPPELAEAVAALVLPAIEPPDPWWQAGVAEALET